MVIWFIATFFCGVYIGKRIQSKRAGGPSALKNQVRELLKFTNQYRDLVAEVVEKYEELSHVPEEQRDSNFYRQVSAGKREANRLLRKQSV
jgi:ubiquinone biosynthesis protein UbiJ